MDGFRGGLEGVVVAETRLSEVDGERGRLFVRGRRRRGARARARASRTSTACCSAARCRAARERARIAARLGAARAEAFAAAPRARRRPRAPRTAWTRCAPASRTCSEAADAEASRARIVGAAAVFAAAWARRPRRRAARSRPTLPCSHAADFLRMATGRAPRARPRAGARRLPRDGGRSRHERVDLHGARRRLDRAPTASRRWWRRSARSRARSTAARPARCSTCSTRSASRRAPRPGSRPSSRRGGASWASGHRVYRVRDPRAAVLEAAVERLEAAGVASRYLTLARAVERAALGVLARRHPDRRLETNVEFYTAVVLDAVGLPRALFTPTFAVGARASAGCAHVEEQLAEGRIIRPEQRYVGPAPRGRRRRGGDGVIARAGRHDRGGTLALLCAVSSRRARSPPSSAWRAASRSSR